MTRVVVVALFVLTLGAGVVAGMLVARWPAHAQTSSTSPAEELDSSPLVEALQLNPSQRDQMRTIWQGVKTKIESYYAQYDDLQRQRDQDILKILNPDQQAKFQALAETYKTRADALLRQRQQCIADAVAQTKQILNPAQQQKYEQIIRDRLGPDGLPRVGVGGIGVATEPTGSPPVSIAPAHSP